MDPRARNLCEKLLVLDPAKRLGGGPKGSDYDYNALRRHEFFDGIDFAKVHTVPPPIEPGRLARFQSEKKPVPEEELGLELNLPDPDMLAVSGPTAASCEVALSESSESGELRAVKKTLSLPMLPDKVSETIKEGVVKKNARWVFYNERKLVLTSIPTLSYCDPTTGTHKVRIRGFMARVEGDQADTAGRGAKNRRRDKVRSDHVGEDLLLRRKDSGRGE